jgi:hypothetical protein
VVLRLLVDRTAPTRSLKPSAGRAAVPDRDLPVPGPVTESEPALPLAAYSAPGWAGLRQRKQPLAWAPPVALAADGDAHKAPTVVSARQVPSSYETA